MILNFILFVDVLDLEISDLINRTPGGMLNNRTPGQLLSLTSHLSFVSLILGIA